MKAVLGLVTLAALAGCSAVFGLSPAANGDPDRDGVATVADNCPDVFNPDQSNIDGDELGDACDACDQSDSPDVDMDGIPDACDGCVGSGVDADGNGIDDGCELCEGNGADADGDGVDDNCDLCPGFSDHDEDRDGLPDDCDRCPAVASPDQQDTDGDGVGDACDPSIVPSASIFDPFTTVDPAWYVDGEGWSLDPVLDEYRVTAAGPTVRFRGRVAGQLVITTQARFAPTGVSDAATVEVLAVEQHTQLGTPAMRCGVDRGGHLYSTSPTATPIVSSDAIPNPTLPFVLTLDATGLQPTYKCAVAQPPAYVTLSQGLPPATGWEPGLAAAAADARFSYFAAVGAKE